MNGITFGKYLKNIREKAKKPSKELSTEVGKAVTYVSQLERGLIKKPDFDTCYKLLVILGIEEEQIEDILSYYGIISAKRKQAELEWNIKEAKRQWDFDWLDQKSQKLKITNDKLYNTLNMFIDKDLTRVEKPILNIQNLMVDKDKFDFFCSLFKYDYSKISIEDRKELIQLINTFITDRYEKGEWNELIKKGVR